MAAGNRNVAMGSPSAGRRTAAATTSDSPPSPKPPALPSRLRKPATSPLKAGPKPVTTASTVNGGIRPVPPVGKPAAPLPQPMPPPVTAPASKVVPLAATGHYAVPNAIGKVNNTIHSPSKRVGPPESATAGAGSSRLPRPMLSPKTTGSGGGESAPLSTSSPKIGVRPNAAGSNLTGVGTRADTKENVHNLVNGHHQQQQQQQQPKVDAGVAEDQRENGSLDSGSFEQDSLDRSTELDLNALCGQSEATVHRVISRLTLPVGLAPTNTAGLSTDAARERLIDESRQFVTASKMFVKSVTDSPQTMVTCLNQCVVLVERMGLAAEELSGCASAERDHRDLMPKVRDVARAFLHTLRAAADASGQGVNDPSMGRLMGKATALAGVLTVLMRSLRP